MKTCTKCGETKPLSEFSADDDEAMKVKIARGISRGH